MARTRATTTLAPLSPEEIEELPENDRHAEAWLMLATGTSQRKVAEHFEVTTTTIRKWTESYARSRMSRADLVDIERERMIGQMEGVANAAWARFQAIESPTAMTGPSYLKTIVEAAQVIIKLRGLDVPAERNTGGRETRVIVSFGGTPVNREQAGGIQGAIDVAVLEEQSA